MRLLGCLLRADPQVYERVAPVPLYPVAPAKAYISSSVLNTEALYLCSLRAHALAAAGVLSPVVGAVRHEHLLVFRDVSHRHHRQVQEQRRVLGVGDQGALCLVPPCLLLLLLVSNLLSLPGPAYQCGFGFVGFGFAFGVASSTAASM